MKLSQRLKLLCYKLVALFILKLTYSRLAKILLVLSGIIFLLLFLIKPNYVYSLLFLVSIAPCMAALMMKPYDDIIVISRITGSPHVLIRNRAAIRMCFEGDKLNSILLLNVIKQSMYKFLYEYAAHSKRTYITTYTHKIMFKRLGLDKLDFIRDIKEIKPGVIRDKLIFVSFKEILLNKDLPDLTKKVPYYKFKIDMKLLKEYLGKNPGKS